VRVDTCSPATSGGVLLPDDQRERMDMAAESGVIYAIGNTAWEGYAEHERPRLGDRIAFQRYSGLTPNGLDGEKYRVMDATCIACVLQDDLPEGA
jgi:co-chaperonin GroES (HSP10)